MMNANLPDLIPTGFISVSGEVAIHPADDGRQAETRSSATAGGGAETAKQRAKRRLDEYYQAVDEAKQNYVKRIENSEGDVTPPPGLRKRQPTQSTIATRRLRQVRQQRTDQLLDPTDDQRPGEKDNFESSDGRKGRKSGKRGYGNGHDESDVSEHEFDRRARYVVRMANHAKLTQSKHQASSDEAGEQYEHEHMNMGMVSQGLGSIREQGMDMSSMNMSVSFGDGGTRKRRTDEPTHRRAGIPPVATQRAGTPPVTNPAPTHRVLTDMATAHDEPHTQSMSSPRIDTSPVASTPLVTTTTTNDDGVNADRLDVTRPRDTRQQKCSLPCVNVLSHAPETTTEEPSAVVTEPEVKESRLYGTCSYKSSAPTGCSGQPDGEPADKWSDPEESKDKGKRPTASIAKVGSAEAASQRTDEAGGAETQREVSAVMSRRECRPKFPYPIALQRCGNVTAQTQR